MKARLLGSIVFASIAIPLLFASVYGLLQMPDLSSFDGSLSSIPFEFSLLSLSGGDTKCKAKTTLYSSLEDATREIYQSPYIGGSSVGVTPQPLYLSGTSGKAITAHTIALKADCNNPTKGDIYATAS